MNFEKINELESNINLNKAFEGKAFSLLHKTEVKGENDDVWEKIIIANELKLLGADIEEELNLEERQKISEELYDLRKKLNKSENVIDYIDLARCIYRFKNLNIPYEELNQKEKEGILNLPDIFRNDENLKGHLMYLPQIAISLDVDINDIKKSQDGLLARQVIEDKISGKDKIEVFNSMALSGLLLDLDQDEFKKMIVGEHWSNANWNETVDYLISLKNSPEKKDWYVFLRLANPANKIVNFLEENE